MLLAILYSAFRLLLDALVDRQRPDADLRLELLVLRHQPRVLERQVKRPRWRPADRLTLAGLSRRLPRPIWLSFLVSPQTLLRWHRDLVRRRWAMFARRPRRGRPGLVAERRELMLIVGRRHLEYVLKEFVEHYQEARPHQGLNQRTPSGQPGVTPLAAGRVVRQDRLGGLIHEYDRAAA